MAAADVQDIAQADSGFFVYRKRALIHGFTTQSPGLYAPWGVFRRDEHELQGLLGEMTSQLNRLNSMMERWLLTEDIPSPELKSAWEKYELLEVGVWPLVSREQMIGAIVVTRTRAVESHLTVETGTALMDACAAQISLALDLILAGRIAEEASQRDLLTGLLNRRGLEARLSQMIEASKGAASHVVFGLIDLDGLKGVNDSHGHPAGDEVLRSVANIIKQNLGPDDLIARFGGDEFAVLLRTERTDASAAMLRLQQVVDLQLSGHSVSVGGALWEVDGDSLEQCYRVADERLYDCKRLSKVGSSFDMVSDSSTYLH